jgi:hypothetical protein
MNNLFRKLLTTSKDDLDRLEENIKARRLKHMNLFKTFPLSSFPTGNQSKDTEDYDSTLSDFSTNHNCTSHKSFRTCQFLLNCLTIQFLANLLKYYFLGSTQVLIMNKFIKVNLQRHKEVAKMTS